ncbi:hypothetical protein E8E11_005684 [Didymella keratinophila]|nr:hypothetical protein E8E11_005684 [Didymella keratinophila]
MTEVKSEGVEESKYAWYLHGNEVAREKSVFEGEMIKRYNVTWGCKANPIQVANEGAGGGEDFVDLLQKDDLICLDTSKDEAGRIISMEYELRSDT